MTDDDLADCQWVIDCAGLHEISTTQSDNLRRLYIDCLSNGEIAVPAAVLKEFRDLYSEEAELIEPNIAKIIKLSQKYRAGAARAAEKLNSGFSRGPYDNETDLYTASIATIEGYVVLTVSSETPNYDRMGCSVLDLASWVESRV